MKALIAIVTATLLSAGAIAGDDYSKKTTTAAFESLDKNADQQISKSEAAAEKMVSDSFAAMDTNGDGYLSKSEYAARTKS
jgi:Ca2+-binding EF-hand superfamily protein